MTGRYVFLLIGAGLQKRFVFEFVVLFVVYMYVYTHCYCRRRRRHCRLSSSINNRPLPWWMAVTARSLTAFSSAALVLVTSALVHLVQCLSHCFRATPSLLFACRGNRPGFQLRSHRRTLLNSSVHGYKNNHHAAFHYNSYCGRVNNDYAFARHYVKGKGPFAATLMLRGSDRTVSFSVNGVPQDGAWALPTTDVFYLMLAAVPGGVYNDNNIAVTDVSVAMTNLA